LTGKDKFYQYAEKALKTFSARAKNQHILTGYYYSALDAYFNMLTLTLHTTKSELVHIALSLSNPYTNIVYGEDKGFVLPCLGTVCYEPIDNPEALKEFLKKRRQKAGKVENSEQKESKQ
jgi:uncharacterized protein YyaL (SSP411 family)